MRIMVQQEVAAPAEDVFAYLADLTNNPQWQSGIATTRLMSDPPVRVGSEFEQTLDEGGKVGYEVVALEPGRWITVQTVHGAAIPSTVTRRVQRLDVDRSRVRVELVGGIRGWRWIATPLAKWAIRRSIQADYRRLQQVFEPDEE